MYLISQNAFHNIDIKKRKPTQNIKSDLIYLAFLAVLTLNPKKDSLFRLKKKVSGKYL